MCRPSWRPGSPRSAFGVEGEATPLDGERDRNFRIDARGRLVRPQGRQSGRGGGHRRDAGARDGARAHGRPRAADRPPSPHRRRPADGLGDDRRRGARRSARRPHRRHLPAARPCEPDALAARSAPPSPASTRRSPGSPTHSPTGRCSGTWPGCRELRHQLAYLAAERRELVERYLDRYDCRRRAVARVRRDFDDPRRRQPRQHPRQPRRPGARRGHRRLRRPRPRRER